MTPTSFLKETCLQVQQVCWSGESRSRLGVGLEHLNLHYRWLGWECSDGRAMNYKAAGKSTLTLVVDFRSLEEAKHFSNWVCELEIWQDV